MHDQDTQTLVQDLCGDSIGIKKRKNPMNLAGGLTPKVERPVFFPDFSDYSSSYIRKESKNLKNNPLVPELRKKHIRIRKLLTSVQKVTFKQEYFIRDEF